MHQKRNNGLKGLIASARKAERPVLPAKEGEVLEAPLGFATRTAALWGEGRSRGVLLWERLAWRGFALAVAVCLVTAFVEKRVVPDEMQVELEQTEMSPEEVELF